MSDQADPQAVTIHDRVDSFPPVADCWHELSANQRSFWFQYHLRPDLQGSFNLNFVARMEPAVDPERLRRALNALAARHTMLRTRFKLIDGEPRQSATSSVQVPVFTHHVDSMEESVLWPRIESERTSPFDLESAPLLRASLYSTGNDACVMVIVADHIVADGWSIWQMIDELALLLKQDLASNSSLRVTSDAGEYFAYVKQQREWLGGPKGQKQLDYWRGELAQAMEELQLPADRHAGREVRATRTRVLPPDLTVGLRNLAAQHGTSTFAVLLTGYLVLLSRLTGQRRLAIGAPMPAREDKWSDTVGCFANPVVIRVEIDDSLTVRDLLKQVHSKAWRALRNQSYPLAELVHQLNPSRSIVGQPFYRVLFVGQKARAAEQTVGLMAHAKSVGKVAWGGFELSAFGEIQNAGGSGIDQVFEYAELGDTIVAALEYDASRFSGDTIERWLASWQCILEAMAADLAQPAHALNLLPPAELEQVLKGWNDTAVAYPQDRCVHELFEQQAASRGQAPAVRHEGQSLSYGQLNERANRLARRLRQQGVGPDRLVAICAQRSLDMVVALLAVLKAGGAYVPLDPAYPGARLAHMLSDSEPVVVLEDDTGRQALQGMQTEALRLHLQDDSAQWAGLDASDLSRQDTGLQPQHLAYVIYTSGSTGQPKGVMVEHRSLVNYALDAIRWFGLSERDVVLQQNSLNFDLSLEEIVPALLAGAAVMPSREFFGVQASSVRPSVVHLTAAHWHTLVSEWASQPAQAQAQLSGVRLVNVTGDALSPYKLQQWETLKPPETVLINTYGPTETTVSCSASYARHDPAAMRVSIGRPFANTALYVLDAHGQPVPIGVVGELYIAGHGVARGYLNLPELTAQRFVNDPFSTHDPSRMYRTGDLVRWRSDGELEYIGRNDFQAKVRGFRVEMGEVEVNLAGCEGVSEVVVLARDDERQEKQLVAYVTGPVQVEALRAHAETVLPQYMQPMAYVKMDALPKTAGGKLDRQALPQPQGDAYVSRGYEAPQGATEEKLAQIWRQLLGVQQVSRHDNFFELGGDSLMGMRMLIRARAEFNVNIDVAGLFTHSTIAAMESLIVTLQLAQFDPAELEQLLR